MEPRGLVRIACDAWGEPSVKKNSNPEVAHSKRGAERGGKLRWWWADSAVVGRCGGCGKVRHWWEGVVLVGWLGAGAKVGC